MCCNVMAGAINRSWPVPLGSKPVPMLKILPWG
jgi:hypothetical protein